MLMRNRSVLAALAALWVLPSGAADPLAADHSLAQAPYPGMVSPEKYLAQARERVAQGRELPPYAPGTAPSEADPLPAGVKLPVLDRERLMRETEQRLEGVSAGAGLKTMPPVRFPGIAVPERPISGQ